MTLGQGHDTPLGHRQQLRKVLSKSKLSVKSYSLYTHFGYMCIVTLGDMNLGQGKQLRKAPQLEL